MLKPAMDMDTHAQTSSLTPIPTPGQVSPAYGTDPTDPTDVTLLSAPMLPNKDRGILSLLNTLLRTRLRAVKAHFEGIEQLRNVPVPGAVNSFAHPWSYQGHLELLEAEAGC